MPHHSVPRLGSACPLSGIAPWVAAMGHPWPRVCKNRLKHRSARSADRCRTDDQTCNARTATSGPAIASEAPLLV
ncbi:hypothetical protein F6476_14510 [Pseudomonas umsongensis]|nr:hypothetical protein F6476_14510 [Pseudomonas umsongensis]